MAPAIEVAGLTKRFGATLAVDDLSFTVEPGKIVGFLGPNGAGKTTTLRIVLGLVRPTEGTATVEGRPYVQLEDPVHTVGALLDGGMLHPGRSGRNHLRSLARASGVGDARVSELLRADGAEVTGDGDRAILVRGRSGEEIGRVIAGGGIVISELGPVGSSLEEIFFELTGAEGGPS